MSTNPFRRSSLKASSSTTPDISSSNPIDIPHDSISSGTPLTVNTKGIGASQKHVNFASPPGIPISPASYPSSSPESTRALAFPTNLPIAPGQFKYSDAIQSNPFRAEAATGADDGAIEEALKNTRANINIAAINPQKNQEDAVKATLSRFASAPRRPPGMTTGAQAPRQPATPNRQTMDVDAFKRLLLTGESGNNHPATGSPSTGSTTGLGAVNVSDSSSSADTVSTTHRSMFDQKPATEDTNSSSSESSEGSEIESVRLSTNAVAVSKSKRPPPPPKSRHGKTLTDKPTSPVLSEQADVISTPMAITATPVEKETADQVKQAPPPPVTRRRSQNNEINRGASSQQLQANDLEYMNSTPELSPKAPPPPPTRRPGSMMERRTSADLPTTLEEPDLSSISNTSGRKFSDARPPPPPARHSSGSKRISLGTMAPPLPPPRRGRGSSRSSIDSQRPSLSAIINPGSTASARSSVDLGKPETEDTRKASQVSNTNEIMAELAALQREVDEARRSAGR